MDKDKKEDFLIELADLMDRFDVDGFTCVNNILYFVPLDKSPVELGQDDINVMDIVLKANSPNL